MEFSQASGQDEAPRVVAIAPLLSSLAHLVLFGGAVIRVIIAAVTFGHGGKVLGWELEQGGSR